MGEREPAGNVEAENCRYCGRVGEPGTMHVPEGSLVIDTTPPIYEWWCTDREGCEAQAYMNSVKAPLSAATIDALAEALKSGDVPRRRVRRRTNA